MPKKVKTKKQKIQSDSRRKMHTTPIEAAESPTYTLPLQKNAQEATLSVNKTVAKTKPYSSSKVTTTGYQYLTKDLRKTLLLTASIVVAQLLISYFVK